VRWHTALAQIDTTADWVFVATELPHTPAAAKWLPAPVGPSTRIVAAQNGVAHRERFAELTDAPVVPALVYFIAERLAVGSVQVRHLDRELVLPDDESGRPRPMIEFLFDTARTVTDLALTGTLERFPRIRFIVTHGGGVLPLLADRIELFRTEFQQGDPDGGDARSQLARLWFDTAGTPFPHQIPILTDMVGDDQVVYGSDYCWTPAPAVVRQVRSLDAARGGWRWRSTRNADRVLTVGGDAA
jgi:hypothetical protein